MVIKNEAVDLTAVLHAAVDTVRAAAAAKAIILETDMDESARFITGDADRLQQVVWNLLSNSLKFTPVNGRVRLRLRKNQSNAEIIVEDTGEGISPEFLPRVFDRFCQADGGTARQHGGLGLGLAVVRYLVEAHGGVVRVKSDGKGLGSTFIVSLPIVRVGEALSA